MRDAENESQEGKRKAEGVWGIMRITHMRSRYIYDLYYKREAISRELYDWLLEQGYADAAYDMNYEGSTCICRVPKAQLRPGTFVECVHCGCRGCSSAD
ncbi:Component of the SF3b subcomplex of the U2 snRNP [Malassezia pachydermatis]